MTGLSHDIKGEIMNIAGWDLKYTKEGYYDCDGVEVI